MYSAYTSRNYRDVMSYPWLDDIDSNNFAAKKKVKVSVLL